MKRKIDVFENISTIMEKLKGGVLLTTNCKKVNSMTISWGAVGIDWGKPVFTTYVRGSRYTRAALDNTGEFSVNIPLDGNAKAILGFCGSKSGRDYDKVKELGLELEDGEAVGAPGIKQLPLTLECKVINKHLQPIDNLPDEVKAACYPPLSDGKPDLHIVYYGEIVNAYIAE